MTNEIITVIGRPGTVYILEYLHTHEKTQYTNLLETKAVPSLNVRLKQLLKLHLIEHHFVRKDTRKEWYEITEKGERVLQLIQKLQKISINS
jgi:DNA-binding HxlR family transcriptional regulator